MRKLFIHTLYWALVYIVGIALGAGIAHALFWLVDVVGLGPLAGIAFATVPLLLLFVGKVASSCRDSKSDASIRAQFAVLGRICRALLCWRTVLLAVLAFFAWSALSDIGAYREAHSWAVPDALLVLGLLVGLAALAFLAGRESRGKTVRNLHGLIAAAQADYESLSAHHASMLTQLDSASAPNWPSTKPGVDALSRADLLAASQQFAAHA